MLSHLDLNQFLSRSGISKWLVRHKTKCLQLADYCYPQSTNLVLSRFVKGFSGSLVRIRIGRM